MKHRIRINGEVKEIDCELGTDAVDKNGNEIFEGDCVTYKRRTPVYDVTYQNGEFLIAGFPFAGFITRELEIVGHVKE